MTQNLGRGGSTTVKSDGTLEHTSAGIGTSDPGYADAVRKAPIESSAIPGTLNRRPGYADRLESDPKPATQKSAAPRPAIDQAPADPSFKPNTK